MTKLYAHVEDNKVVNIAVWETEPHFEPSDTGFWVDVTDKGVHIGDTYNPETGEFTHPEPEPEPQPEIQNKIVITNLTTDDANGLIDQDFKEITIHEESTVTAEFEIHKTSDDSLNTDYSGTFRLPIQKQNGDTIYTLITISSGKGSVSVKMPQGALGLWKVTQDNINSKLPEESQLQFDGLDIYVVL